MTGREDRYIPARIKLFLYRLERDVCAYCGVREVSEIDHIIPLALGGRSEPGNLVGVCFECNHAKSDQTLAEWFAAIGERIQSAFLRRFDEQRPFEDIRPRKPSFEEIVNGLTTSAEDGCWVWPTERYRSTTLHRRVYAYLRRPLMNEHLVARRDACHTRRMGEAGYCVNPDHFTVMSKPEYRVYTAEISRAAARQRALERSQTFP